jgi:hypothetical protein
MVVAFFPRYQPHFYDVIGNGWKNGVCGALVTLVGLEDLEGLVTLVGLVTSIRRALI